MQTFTLDIPDGAVPRIINALCKNYGYQEQIEDPQNPGTMIDNPQTKQQFGMDRVKDYLVANVRQCEQTKAAEAAIANVEPISI